MGDERDQGPRDVTLPGFPKHSHQSSTTLPLYRVIKDAQNPPKDQRSDITYVAGGSSGKEMPSSSGPQVTQLPGVSKSTTEFEDNPSTAHSNTLRITASSFSIELEGDSSFVQASYAVMRNQILERLRDILRDNTVRDQEETTAIVKRVSHHGGFIWVYVCHPLYNKIHIVSRDALRSSTLGSVISPDALNKIYVERRGLAELENLVGSSKTLWSELTTEGRARLKQAGS